MWGGREENNLDVDDEQFHLRSSLNKMIERARIIPVPYSKPLLEVDA
jgi:hypothetical protein